MVILSIACAVVAHPADDSGLIGPSDTATDTGGSEYFQPYALAAAWMAGIDETGELTRFADPEDPGNAVLPFLWLRLVDQAGFLDPASDLEHTCDLFVDASGARRDDSELSLQSDARWGWELHAATVIAKEGRCDDLDPAIYRDSVEEWVAYHTWGIGIGPLDGPWCDQLDEVIDESGLAGEFGATILAGYLYSSFLRPYLDDSYEGIVCLDADLTYAVQADGVTMGEALDAGDGAELLLPQVNVGRSVGLYVSLSDD